MLLWWQESRPGIRSITKHKQRKGSIMTNTNTLTATQEAKLTRLKNYATRYEAVITDGQTSYLLAYICGHSFRHLLSATQSRVEAVNKATNMHGELQYVGEVAK